MNKVKEFILKNKLVLIIVGSLLLVGVIIGVILLRPEKSTTMPESNNGKSVEHTYTMYVKINPLVKLTLKETYIECLDDDGNSMICSGIEDSIIDYELINDDAKDVYNDLNFNGKTVLEALVMLCDTARENDIGFEKLEITSDWDHMPKEEQIKEALKTNSTYEHNISVFVDFNEYPEKSDILEELKKYTVKFETNGGSEIEAEQVLENTKVSQPKDPIKDGYIFVEWQLNNKKYDFTKEVTTNLTLKAKWKKVDIQNENDNTPKEDNSNKEENTTPKPEEPVIKDTTESRIEKINLNENILFYRSGGGFSGGCSAAYKMFATNLETIFPGYVKNKTLTIITQETLDNIKEYDYQPDISGMVMESEWISKRNQITFDSAKEDNMIRIFNEIKGTKYSGIGEFNYSFNNHELEGYSYTTIALEDYDKFITLNKSLNDISNKLDSKLNNATSGMYLIQYYGGGCGDMPEPMLLNEEYCNNYNLNCDRW
ncbi:MAG: InlB B-repeat-containing protein [Bacilli bacterium]|nr:InlB B-repeat-containing protein [Bacilli bacterium]